MQLTSCLSLIFSLCAVAGLVFEAVALDLKPNGYHVFPGDNIQEALQAAAKNPTNKVVKVHAGEYRPTTQRFALIWFNKMHEGIRLEAVGEVTLSAANPQIADPRSPTYPAIANHVVYFGDGISGKTVLDGFRLTGANHFVTERSTKQIEPDTTIPKNLFFYTDGGGIKIFGRSYPTLRNLTIGGNYASPCGAGISIQHEGFVQDSVLIENCLFLTNKTQVTGAALDLLAGSAARVINCLFVGNISNTGLDTVAERSGEPPFTNSGVVTIFQGSRGWFQNCTFTGNRNGVDDLGGGSVYTNCIFFNNRLEGGLAGGKRYDLDLREGGVVTGCLIDGAVLDPRNRISTKENFFQPPDPQFGANWAPKAPLYTKAGYRPAGARTSSSAESKPVPEVVPQNKR